MTAYYNEIDPYAAQWLRNLIAAGHIAAGEVDERSIEDVHPTDLQDFTQCHFFAGIGGWPLALRRAGWPDNRPVWTGSCPCQPFSAAGQGAGFADERHLWPAFYHLIGERRPAAVLGEQVASKDADPWIDLVQDDLEGLGYRVGAVPFPSAGVGAPHIRDRLYWAANAGSAGLEKRIGITRVSGRSVGRGARQAVVGAGIRVPGGLAHAGDRERHGFAVVRGAERNGADTGREESGGQPQPRREDDGLIWPDTYGPEWDTHDGLGPRWEHEDPGPTNGYWRAADWLGCRDAKWRPVEAGTFPLADGLPRSVGSGGAELERLARLAGLDNASLARAKNYRVGALRGYGNAINPEQAAEFIRCVMECQPC